MNVDAGLTSSTWQAGGARGHIALAFVGGRPLSAIRSTIVLRCQALRHEDRSIEKVSGDARAEGAGN